MSWRLITVLWEDSCGTQVKAFGSHALLLSCIADLLNRDRFALGKFVIASAKKGNSKLKGAIDSDCERLSRSGPVIAVFDDDQVRRLYNLPPNACKIQIIREARSHPSLDIVLLERNIEDLVDACCEALGIGLPETKSRPDERDKILNAAASAIDPKVREFVCEKIPSFSYLVRKVRLGLEQLSSLQEKEES